MTNKSSIVFTSNMFENKLKVHLLRYYVLLISICFSTSFNTNHVERYSHSGVQYYQQLLFDVQNYQLIVGARDYLVRLGLDNFNSSRPETQYIPADSEKQKLCQTKGMKRWQCHNFITVLLPITGSKQILICGTNAFSPECEIRQLLSLSTVIKQETGISKSAFSPLWNTSSFLTQSGDYFYAGPLDFRGIDAAVLKHSNSPLSPQTTLMSNKKTVLRTMQSDSKWVNADANFVFSFEFENHIYFLFRESAVEYINCGKKIYSRIGRVCKNDAGGQNYYKENWTSFLKSRLNCSIPGLFPFYFDEIQSVDLLPSNDVATLYATFNTPENSIHGSAICAFSISSVLSSFHGQFKHQKSTDSMWESSNANRDLFECQASARNGSELHQMLRLNSKFQLMDSAVQSVNGRPYVIETDKRFQFIAVDVIQTKHQNSVEVIFVSTTDGLLMKYVQWPFSTKACLIDQIRVIPNTSDDTILSMKHLKDTQSLYLGTKREILRIPVERCHSYAERSQCLLSGDPYCGWDQLKMACTTAPSRNPKSQEWIQNDSTQCFESKTNQWTDWYECNQLNKSFGDRCLCRTRACSQSSYNCIDGKEVQVTNCTVNGGWSDWSQWSICSASCGTASKYRYRQCSNPAPAFGGRNCRGTDKEFLQCLGQPPCVDPSRPVEPVNHWSEWSQWSGCSAKCGGGVQLRTRRCDKSEKCMGCDKEWRICNRHECEEVKKQTEWTEWFTKTMAVDGTTQQRIRYICKTHSPDSSDVNLQSKVEERFFEPYEEWSQCSNDSCNGWQFKWNGTNYMRRQCASCSGWSTWGQWSRCFLNGQQFRTRECDGSDRCVGHFKEYRECNPMNDKIFANNEINEIDPINDGVPYRTAASSKNFEQNSKDYSVSSIILYLFLSFSAGAILSGIIVYIFVAKKERIKDMRHHRLSLRLFSTVKSTANAYESPQDYKSNQSALSPLNTIPPVNNATIKRSSTIRAQLHSDQNF